MSRARRERARRTTSSKPWQILAKFSLHPILTTPLHSTHRVGCLRGPCRPCSLAPHRRPDTHAHAPTCQWRYAALSSTLRTAGPGSAAGLRLTALLAAWCLSIPSRQRAHSSSSGGTASPPRRWAPPLPRTWLPPTSRTSSSRIWGSSSMPAGWHRDARPSWRRGGGRGPPKWTAGAEINPCVFPPHAGELLELLRRAPRSD